MKAFPYGAGVMLLLLLGCEREERRFNPPPSATPGAAVRVVDLQPGPPVKSVGVPSPSPGRGPYEENAYGVSQGKTLYNQFNCSGCHSQGGGGMGPALMDAVWIYGSEPEQVFETIVQGRPNGMPAFGGRIPDQQAWQIVAYVQSLSGNVSKAAAPARNDDMNATQPENRREPQRPPVQTGHR